MKKKTAGAHIKEWREHHQLTKRHVAGLLKVTPTHVYLLESGQRYASPAVAIRLSLLTELPMATFLNMRPR